MAGIKSCFGLTVLVFVVAGCATQPGRTEGAPNRSACLPLQRKEVHSALLNPQAIVSVSTLHEKKLVARPSPLKLEQARRRAKPIGVRIVLRPSVGITTEWLQLAANCDHALGPEPELATCPFELAGATTTVSSLGDSFALDVVASEPAVVRELLQRGQALNPRP